MVAYPTQRQFALTNMTDINTADFSTEKHYRYNGDPTTPSVDKKLEAQPNLGHENEYDKSDAAIVFDSVTEGGFQTETMIRRGVDGSTEPPLMTMLKAAGYSMTSTALNSVSATPTVSSWTCGTSSGAIGDMAMVNTGGAGIWRPFLLANVSGADWTLAADLPAAPSASDVIQRMYRVIPAQGEITDTDLIGIREHTRVDSDASGVTPDHAIDHTALALSQWGPITFENNGTPVVPVQFHVGDTSFVQDTMGASSFLDGEKYLKMDNNCELIISAANASGGVTRTANIYDFEAVEFTPVNPVSPIAANGGSSSVNSIRGYFQGEDQSTIMVRIMCEKSWLQDTASSGSAWKYIHLAQPTTSLATPGFLLACPNCTLAPEGVNVLREANSYVKVELTYTMSSPKYGSVTTPGSASMAPWFFGISGEAS